MEFKIEKNVPMKKTAKYPFGDMKVGDSFLATVPNRLSFASAALSFGKANQMKFSIKKYGDGFRCWRIK